MQGSNVWHGSGEVIGQVDFGRTGNNDEACSFRLNVFTGSKRVIVRVNVYGGHVGVIRSKGLEAGAYVVIVGEMMTRPYFDDVFMEIRCIDIVITGVHGSSITGTSNWFGSGNLSDDVLYSATRSGNTACSFRLKIVRYRSIVCLRVNAYDEVASAIKSHGLLKGDAVIMSGEIMNRSTAGRWLSEIRCLSIVPIYKELDNV